ncbi:PAS domain-containing protein [Nakamurella sp. YIM 132087]|uniref:histidine kinase n=1 Tax=Nakamurella alba TaxID=2665158 RepID=A0A7K1FJW0_9ACTN|nr:ATP-binding protein [Nakamurella alba]MTD14388.1 PAS domain-containing protein [Nakamurella alba]
MRGSSAAAALPTVPGDPGDPAPARGPVGRMMARLGRSGRSIAARMLVLLTVLLLVVIVVGLGLVFLDSREYTDQVTRERVVAVSTTAASSPGVAEILGEDLDVAGASAALQPYAEQIRLATSVDFVVFLRADGTRLTHPNTTLIGGTFEGDLSTARSGQPYVTVADGSLGPSMRAVTPIIAADGTFLGLVSVGVTQAHISATVQQRMWLLVGVGVVALVVGGLGILLIARRLRRETLGLGPRELARLYSYYETVLDAVHDGMVLLDTAHRVVGINRQGQLLLDLPDEDVAGRTAEEAGITGDLAEIVESDEEITDQLVITPSRVLAVTRRRAAGAGGPVGAVLTMRDHTALQELSGEVDEMRGFTRALRAQAHESANRLHTVVSLLELGEVEEALQFAVEDLEMAQSLADQVVEGMGEPAVAALLLGKSAEASERGVELIVDPDSDLPHGAADARELVTVLGNLVDNAIDAAAAAPLTAGDGRAGPAGPPGTAGVPRRMVGVRCAPLDDRLVLEVWDTGAGLSAEVAERIFADGFTTKSVRGPAGARGLGLALVRQAVARCGGTVQAVPGDHGRFRVELPLVGHGDRRSGGAEDVAPAAQDGTAAGGSAGHGSAHGQTDPPGGAVHGPAAGDGTLVSESVEPEGDAVVQGRTRGNG